MDLIQDFFTPIAKHVKEHVVRWQPLLGYPNTGNESWLKSEIIYALKMVGMSVRSMHGRGSADLCLYGWFIRRT